jgi:hypothetical protein
MKYETYHEYNPRGVLLAERALLTVWSGLSRYHDDLVLIGGLVPKYLCGDVTTSRDLPHPVTLDADLGIALGASAGSYGSLHWDLRAQGFEKSSQPNSGSRYTKTVEGFVIPVDFLAEQPGVAVGTVVVDDIVADVLPGVARALKLARSVVIEGCDLHGANQKISLRVCEVGPFLAMKLRAFARRQQPKDAFDIFYTLRHYDGGTESAVRQFAAEVTADNPAIPDALACLREHFKTESSAAPIKAAVFIYGPPTAQESGDQRTFRLRVQQDVVNAGRLLLDACA